MMKVLSWSSSALYGFLFTFAHIGLLLLTAPGMAISSQSQFSDECTPKIYDITQPLPKKGIPAWGNTNLRSVVNETESAESKLVYGNIIMGTHWGSHVDSLAHAKPYYEQTDTYMADTLNLNTLMGPVLVVDTPRDSNITSAVLKSLKLPAGLKRIIFRTENTDRRLQEQEAFASDYTGLTADGALWLASNTTIDFVGIDYMSIAVLDEVVAVHTTFFNKKSVIPVEFLKLDEVKPGYYTVYCLPLKLHAEGAPVRCILVG